MRTNRGAATIASLPVTYGPERRSLVQAVSGEPGWAERAAELLRRGSDTVVVVERPVPSSTDELTGYESRVVIDSAWAHNPVVAQAEPLFQGNCDTLVSLHVDVPVGETVGHGVLDGLLVLDQLIGLADLAVLDRSDDRFSAEGHAENGCLVDVTAVLSTGSPGAVRVRTVGDERTVDLSIGDPDVAMPPTLSLSDAIGTWLPRTSWETSSRGAWRRAAALASRAVSDHHDLADYRALHRHMTMH